MLYNYTVNKILQKKSHYEKLSKVGNVSIFGNLSIFSQNEHYFF